MSRYRIWNSTDGIPCDFNRTYTSKKKAEEGIVKLREGFRHQGYYKDNRGNRIPVEDIQYTIMKV
jgi:hypothetical protein